MISLQLKEYPLWLRYNFQQGHTLIHDADVMTVFYKLLKAHKFEWVADGLTFLCTYGPWPLSFTHDIFYPNSAAYDIGVPWGQGHTVMPYAMEDMPRAIEHSYRQCSELLRGPVATETFMEEGSDVLYKLPDVKKFSWLCSPVCVAHAVGWEEHLMTHPKKKRNQIRQAIQQFEERGYIALQPDGSQDDVLFEEVRRLYQQVWGDSPEFNLVMVNHLWGMAVKEVYPERHKQLLIVDNESHLISASFDLFENGMRIATGLARTNEPEHSNIGLITLSYTIMEMVKSSGGWRKVYDPTAFTHPIPDDTNVFKTKVCNTNNYVPIAVLAKDEQEIKKHYGEEVNIDPPYFLLDNGWVLPEQQTVYGVGV